jgi:hypothetical protein
MKPIVYGIMLALSATLLIAGQGTVPLRVATAYQAHVEVGGIAIGASLLRDLEVKQRFITDLGRDFLVVEVAIYPKSGVEMQVQADQFGLRINDERVSRPENPKVIAAYLQKAESSKKDIVIVPMVGVGYETGRGTYDPATGTYRRQGGVYTSTGVMVGIEPSADANPRNEDTMALELTEKGVPSGTISKAVGGHLYFRIDKKIQKESKTKYELIYEIDGKEVALELKKK